MDEDTPRRVRAVDVWAKMRGWLKSRVQGRPVFVLTLLLAPIPHVDEELLLGPSFDDVCDG